MHTVHVLPACLQTAETADEPARQDVGRHRVVDLSADQGLSVACRYRNVCAGVMDMIVILYVVSGGSDVVLRTG